MDDSINLSIVICLSIFMNQNKFVFSVFSRFGRQLVSARMVHFSPPSPPEMSLLPKTASEYFQTYESDLNKSASEDQTRKSLAKVFLESISFTGNVRLHM